MNFLIYILLLSWHLYYGISAISTLNINKDPKCSFENTVNLTNHHQYQNGSYLYQGKVIPPEILALYDYSVLWGKNITAPLHVRGCICDKYPCIRLCCEKDEYFDEITKKCEKLKKDIVMIWELRIEEFVGKLKLANILNEFIIKIGLPCLDSMELNIIADTATLSQTGSLQTPYKRLESSEFCYSPRTADSTIYTLKPFTCIIRDENLKINNEISKGTFTLMTFLTKRNENLKMIEVKDFIPLLFLIPIALLYYFLKELRTDLSGKLYFYYLYTITMSNIIFALLNAMYFLWSGIWIIIMGFIGLLLHIIAILWLSVFSYDIWRNSRTKTISKQFSIYSLCVVMIACLSSGFLVFEKLFKSYPVESVDISDETLWWNNQRWFTLPIIIPIIFILLFNCIKLIHLMVIIKKDRASGTRKKQFLKNNSIIFLRLLVILVIPWIFKITLPSIADAAQGSFIFLGSVLRIEIWILLKKIKKDRIPKEGFINTEDEE